ncbi:MAG: lactate utilization protein [Desulfofustis sp.]|nr:lactate utilization protein [Desulfofustis sp.]
MEAWHEYYWQLRLERCREALEKNHFNVYSADSCAEARTIFRQTILPSLTVRTASWADSMSLKATGILEDVKNRTDIEVIETFADGVAREELLERRRQALLVDLFLTGTNALTEKGQLVNLDMVGNRVGAITFGPRAVVLIIGRNKLVADVDQAMRRIKNHAAPLNAMRHAGWKTPCRKTAFCHDCRSPDRICNTWTITEKSYPKGRISIILVNEDLGL